MKDEKLTTDEYNALDEVRRGIKGRPSACVARNTKRLSGLKFLSVSREGRHALTDKGQEALFLRRCILGMRALIADPAAVLDGEVLNFLGKKSHIVAIEGGYEVTAKGQETLADIAAQGL
jgi:DNA-binding PadR family transcriptional regulator